MNKGDLVEITIKYACEKSKRCPDGIIYGEVIALKKNCENLNREDIRYQLTEDVRASLNMAQDIIEWNEGRGTRNPWAHVGASVWSRKNQGAGCGWVIQCDDAAKTCRVKYNGNPETVEVHYDDLEEAGLYKP